MRESLLHFFSNSKTNSLFGCSIFPNFLDLLTHLDVFLPGDLTNYLTGHLHPLPLVLN